MTFPFGTCVKDVLPGQIWFTNFPYLTAQLLAADSKAGYYYPKWSPNGEWMAYVEVSPGKTQESAAETGFIRRQLLHSDSIWIMRADGSERKRISQTFPRLELESVGGGCSPYGGIGSLIEWSPDSQSVTFSVAEEKDVVLYQLNVQSEESHIIAHNVVDAIRQPDGNRLALITSTDLAYGTNPTVEIVTLEQSGESVDNLMLPSRLPPKYVFRQSWWAQDNQSLFVIGKDIGASYYAPMTLWQVEIASKKWTKIIDLEKPKTLDYGLPAVICSGTSSMLELRDPMAWQKLSDIEIPKGVVCQTITRLKDAAGNNLISFVDGPHGQVIWAANLSKSSSVAYIIADAATLKFPKDYGVSYMTFRPAGQQ